MLLCLRIAGMVADVIGTRPFALACSNQYTLLRLKSRPRTGLANVIGGVFMAFPN